MAYNKANYFKKIINIQNIVLSEKKKSETKFLKTIYFEKIEPIYFISYRTFCNYLGINAKAELKKYTNANKPSKH